MAPSRTPPLTGARPEVTHRFILRSEFLSTSIRPQRVVASYPGAVAWVLGIGLGWALVGDPVAGGARLNLDLVAIGDLDVPPSLFGIGSELPRWPPVEALFALVSPPLDDATVKGLWMVAIVATAVAGTTHHLREVRLPLRLAAAVIYGMSPFLLTRIGVGHLGTASAAALLPWAFDDLAAPFLRRRATVLFLAGFALCGYYGALIALPVVLIGRLMGSRRFTVGEVATLVSLQIPWLLPAIMTPGPRGDVAGSASFETEIRSVADLALLPLGHGFWLRVENVGARHAGALILVAGILVFGLVGALWAPLRHRRVLLLSTTAGAVVATASTIPGIDGAFDALTSTPAFAPVRESHKLAVLLVFGLIAFAAHGAELWVSSRPRRGVLAAGLVSVGAVVLALSVAGSSFGGLDGRVNAVAVPASWDQAAVVIAREPGTTIVLPWSQYLDLTVADGRRVHQPLPFLLPGDVIIRHDLALPGVDGGEARDKRESAVTTMIAALRLGEPIEGRLADLDVHWIVALPDRGTDDIDRLRSDPTLDVIVDADELTLFEVASPIEASNPSTSGRPERWHWRSWIVLVGYVLWAGVMLVWFVFADRGQPGVGNRARDSQLRYGLGP